MSSKYPEEVPILTARDFCKNILHEGNKSCLNGWVYDTFLNGHGYGYRNVCETIRRVCVDKLPDVPDKQKIHYTRLDEFNDHPKTTKKALAEIWNLSMARLGYTEGNPEAKKLKTKKRQLNDMCKMW